MTIKLNGSTAGSVALDAPASTTSSADIIFKLPVADGTAGQVLQTDGSGNLSWVTPGAGKVLQVQSTTKTDEFEHSSLAESTYSNAAMSVSITPSNASNKILIRVMATVSTNVADTRIAMGIFKAGSILVQGDASGVKTRATAETYQDIQASAETISAEFLDTAGGTSAITYDIRLLHSQGGGANIFLNRSGLDHNSVGYYRTVSTITATEISV